MDAVAMRSDSSVNVTRTETLSTETAVQPPVVLRLRLEKPKSDRKVGWSEETVDNENMGRKKSKCCCIYKKPVAFGESSSEDDEDCDHCFGHPEKRRKNRKKRDRDDGGDGQEHSDEDDDENSDGPVCSFKDKPK